MIPLLDFDVLVYEVGFGVMTGWEGDDPPPFEMAREMLENKVANICALAGGTEPYIGYLTGKDNFREKIATLKPYKGNRSQPKPFHYKNLRAYMEGVMGAIIVDGMEADDAMAIEQMKDLKYDLEYEPYTIICSRDKDLKQVPGWHYTWECGKQPSWGPFFVEGYGEIHLDDKRKLKGWGDKFFLSQCLMGDTTDNIGGIPAMRDVGAFKILTDTMTYPEGLKAVLEAYKGFYGDDGEKNLLENGRLLYMLREPNKMWEIENVAMA